ncbi:hypothetical protein ACFLTX_02780 [Chloroflexota bacterium]
MIKTYIKNRLFQSHRPGYPSKTVTLEEVEKWIALLKEKGIKTIICLLSDEQLRFYDQQQGGLLEIYRKKGFIVIHQPVTDPADDEKGWLELDEQLVPILEAYKKTEKPALIHCSAGVDRSPMAARFIVNRMEKD